MQTTLQNALDVFLELNDEEKKAETIESQPIIIK